MKLFKKLMLALFCAGLALAPLALASHPAEARAGWTSRGNSSMGSMGSRTYNYNGGTAINRSTTPYSNPSAGGAYSGYRGGYGGYHPFWSGLAGGLFGGWLGSMLFPHFGMGYGGYGGYGGSGGGFFSIIIWLGLIYLGYRLFRGFFHRGYGGGFGGGPMPGPGPGTGMGFGGGGFIGGGPGVTGYAGGPAPGQTIDQIAVTPSDQTAFEAILKAVQGAWSKADLSTLRHYVTPEMLSYFSEELSENNSNSLENHVEDVELINGDVRESWSEGNLEYATILLHWRARDWTVRTDGSNAVADGDPHNPAEAQELWTFARSPGGHWLLSAIQQV
jgi:predicted lipid-binding transport protein (Tim44 family)